MPSVWPGLAEDSGPLGEALPRAAGHFGKVWPSKGGRSLAWQGIAKGGGSRGKALPLARPC